MSRYIDADKLFLHFNDWALAVSPDERNSDVPEYSEHKINEMIYRTINEAMSAIEQQPTADVVEVVRCKDCKWWKSIFSWNGKEHKVCIRDSSEPTREQNDFCSYGKGEKMSKILPKD